MTPQEFAAATWLNATANNLTRFDIALAGFRLAAAAVLEGGETTPEDAIDAMTETMRKAVWEMAAALGNATTGEPPPAESVH